MMLAAAPATLDTMPHTLPFFSSSPASSPYSLTHLTQLCQQTRTCSLSPSKAPFFLLKFTCAFQASHTFSSLSSHSSMLSSFLPRTNALAAASLPLHHPAAHQSNLHPPTTSIKPRTLSAFRIDVRLHSLYRCCPFRCLLSILVAHASSSFLSSFYLVSFAYILSQGICVISR